MSVITDTWRQLVRRRLWPVALLLLAAVVAVPVLLARNPEPVPAPAAPASDAGSASDGIAEPVVSLAANDAGTSRRHVLGARKDPFQPAPVPKVHHHASTSHSATSPSTVTSPAGIASTTTPGSGSSGGGSTFSPPASSGGGSTSTPPAPSGGGSNPAPPASSTPAPPASNPPAKKPHYPLYSLKVRFGDASGTLTTSRIQKLDPLPDADAPVVIYTGPGADKRSATFLVDQSATPEGDGKCLPYGADCERVVLHKGDTEFFDVTDDTGAVTETYELDLLDIVTPTKADHAQHARHTTRPASLARTAARIARVVRILKPSL